GLKAFRESQERAVVSIGVDFTQSFAFAADNRRIPEPDEDHGRFSDAIDRRAGEDDIGAVWRGGAAVNMAAVFAVEELQAGTVAIRRPELRPAVRGLLIHGFAERRIGILLIGRTRGEDDALGIGE